MSNGCLAVNDLKKLCPKHGIHQTGVTNVEGAPQQGTWRGPHSGFKSEISYLSTVLRGLLQLGPPLHRGGLCYATANSIVLEKKLRLNVCYVRFRM